MPRSPRTSRTSGSRPPPVAERAAALDALLLTPPANVEELGRRLGRENLEGLRQEIVQRLENGSIEDRDASFALTVLGELGPGAMSERLESYVLELGRPRSLRSRALGVLVADAPEKLRTILDRLPPEDATLPVESVVEDMVNLAANAPEAAQELAGLLASTPGPARQAIAGLVVKLRRETDIPPSALYGPLLASAELHELRPLLLGELHEEGGSAAAELLLRLRNRAPGDRARRDFSSALVRIRTREIDPDHLPAEKSGLAWVTLCDGEGAYSIFAMLGAGPKVTLANACIRVHGEVRDGFFRSRLPREEMDRIRDQLTGAGLVAVQVSLQSAATLALEGRKRTEQAGRALSTETRTSLAMLEAAAGADPLSQPRPAPTATVKQLRALLDGKGFDTWFFDAGDLSPLAPPKRLTAAWVAHAAARLMEIGGDARLASMARFGAWWLTEAGEHEKAGLLAAAARDVEADFASAPLVRAMMERSVEVMRTVPAEPPVVFLGNPSLRRSFKHTFFPDVKLPRGKDLARLDFTEVAYLELDHAFEQLTSELRPTDEILRRAAHDFATAFSKVQTASNSEPPTLNLLELFQDSSLPMAERERIVSAVVSGLQGFIREVCAHCQVRCLERPRANVSKAFDLPGHPAFAP